MMTIGPSGYAVTLPRHVYGLPTTPLRPAGALTLAGSPVVPVLVVGALLVGLWAVSRPRRSW